MKERKKAFIQNDQIIWGYTFSFLYDKRQQPSPSPTAAATQKFIDDLDIFFHSCIYRYDQVHYPNKNDDDDDLK